MRRSKSIYIYMSLMLILLFLSCKNEKRTGEGSSVDGGQGVPSDQLVIELSVLVEEDDVFEMFYKEKESTYSSVNSQKTQVKGSALPQLLRFSLDQHTYPQNIRLDFGSNPKQKSVQVVFIRLRFNEATHAFTKEELKKYFKPNKYLVFDFDTMKAEPKTVDEKYDPYLESNNLSAFINKLILY